MHLAILDSFGVQMGTSCAGHAKWGDCCQLSGSARGYDAERAYRSQRPWMEEILGICRAHQGPERHRVRGAFHILLIRR